VDLDLRPASEQDREFLYALHCSTMRDVIEQTWGWDDGFRVTSVEPPFIGMRHDARLLELRSGRREPV
jgi:hypothetical protein